MDAGPKSDASNKHKAAPDDEEQSGAKKPRVEPEELTLVQFWCDDEESVGSHLSPDRLIDGRARLMLNTIDGYTEDSIGSLKKKKAREEMCEAYQTWNSRVCSMHDHTNCDGSKDADHGIWACHFVEPTGRLMQQGVTIKHVCWVGRNA